DPEAEKAEEAVADAELPASTVQHQPPAAAAPIAPASLAPPPEFEVQQTVALENVAEQQSSPASQETRAPEPAPIQTAETQETADAKPVPAPAQEDSSVASAAQEIPAEAEPPPVRGSRWVAENVALTAEEASLELEQEMLKARAASSEPEARAGEAQELGPETRDKPPAITQPSLPSSAPPVEEKPNQTPENSDSGAAFAAVAGASADAAPVMPPQSSSNPQGEATLASQARAAWDNWQRLRDSLVSAPDPSAVAG